MLLEKDVFICSELERASFCLAAVDAALAELWEQYNSNTSHDISSADASSSASTGSNGVGVSGGGSEERKETAHQNNNEHAQQAVGSMKGLSVLSMLQSRSGLLSLCKTLEAQAKAHRDTLVSRIHSQLTHLMAHALQSTSTSAHNFVTGAYIILNT